MQSFVDREVARTSRNLLVTNLVLLAGLAIAAVLGADYYREFFGGPYPATVAQVAEAKRAHSLVRLQDKLVPTGYEKTEDGKSTAVYLAATDGERYLLVRAPLGTSTTAEVSGWVGEPEGVDRDVLAAIRQKEPEVGGALLPVVVDAVGVRTSGAIGLVVAAAVFLLVARNLLVWLSRRARPEGHPIWKRLAQLGEARSLASQLDQETRGGDPKTFKGGATVTSSWLIHRRAYGLGLVPLDRLAWIHKKVTKHKNTGITVGKSYEAIVLDRDGAQLTVRAKEQQVDELLGELARRVPWVLAGWDAKLEEAWKKRRAEVLAAVDARREQRKAGPAAG